MISKEEALSKGYRWRDDQEEKKTKYAGPEVELPDDIADAPSAEDDDNASAQSAELPSEENLNAPGVEEDTTPES